MYVGPEENFLLKWILVISNKYLKIKEIDSTIKVSELKNKYTISNIEDKFTVKEMI